MSAELEFTGHQALSLATWINDRRADVAAHGLYLAEGYDDYDEREVALDVVGAPHTVLAAVPPCVKCGEPIEAANTCIADGDQPVCFPCSGAIA